MMKELTVGELMKLFEDCPKDLKIVFYSPEHNAESTIREARRINYTTKSGNVDHIELVGN